MLWWSSLRHSSLTSIKFFKCYSYSLAGAVLEQRRSSQSLQAAMVTLVIFAYFHVSACSSCFCSRQAVVNLAPVHVNSFSSSSAPIYHPEYISFALNAIMIPRSFAEYFIIRVHNSSVGFVALKIKYKIIYQTDSKINI